MPLYNNEQYIVACIESLLKISDFNCGFEVLVINDGSTDNSYRTVKEAFFDSRYVKIFDIENSGVGSARNFGIEQAKGEYISFMDSDDYMDAAIFFEILKLAKINQLDIAMCNQAIHVNEDTTFAKDDSKSSLSRSILRDENKIFNGIDFLSLSTFNDGVVCTLFKRQLLFDNNIRFSKSIVLEDLLFLYEAILKSSRMISHPKRFYYVRLKQGSATRQNSKEFYFRFAKEMTYVLTGLRQTSRKDLKGKKSAVRLLDQKIQNFVITVLGYLERSKHDKKEITTILNDLEIVGLLPIKWNFYKKMPLKVKLAYYVRYSKFVYLSKLKN